MSIAPQSNPDINPQYYEPSRFRILAITKGLTTTVTMDPSSIGGVTVDPNYVIGQEVRINIPKAYGMRQINRQTAIVISIPSSVQVVLNIDSRFYDSFIVSPSYTNQKPEIIAIGDVNSGAINSSGRTNLGTYIPGSFIDISPS